MVSIALTLLRSLPACSSRRVVAGGASCAFLRFEQACPLSALYASAGWSTPGPGWTTGGRGDEGTVFVGQY